MYSNTQFELLMSNQSRLASAELDNHIREISRIYSDFNAEYHLCTTSYISVVTNLFDVLSVKGLIDRQHGGTLRVSATSPEDVQTIVETISQYHKKLGAIEYLSFLKEEHRHVVFVGANGCGKTTLLRHLISLTGSEDIAYYQADRLLIVDASYSPERNMQQFMQSINSTYGEATNVDSGNQGYYINRQLNQIISLFEKTRSSELEQIVAGTLLKENSVTCFILDKWNELIKTRELFCDGTLKVKTHDGVEYDIKYLSSGEKNIFYFLASILLQPEKKYYFIDEPENNLNPSVVTQLWNIIEMRRPNSIFIYLTHDSDFVSARVNTKNYWIKGFDGETWLYEELPTHDIFPKSLIVNLVGNKQPVLFCESEDESKYDAVLFSIMFPDFKVIPSGGCDKVIARVKAYKAINLPQAAFGVIDCDYKKTDYLSGQTKHGIYHLPFFEIENFLFCEEILAEMICEFSKNKTETLSRVIAAVKSDFLRTRERFVIRNTATRLHEIGFGGKILSLTTRQELITSYTEFSSSVNLSDYFTEYEQLFDSVADSGDLNSMLRYFDCKSILIDYNQILDFKDGKKYADEVLPFLKSKTDLIARLKQIYFEDIHHEQ